MSSNLLPCLKKNIEQSVIHFNKISIISVLDIEIAHSEL
jgi:hypothetical protein